MKRRSPAILPSPDRSAETCRIPTSGRPDASAIIFHGAANCRRSRRLPRVVCIHAKFQAAALGFILILGMPFHEAAASEYPEIARLDTSDMIFRQLQDDIARFNVWAARGGPSPSLALYTYKTKAGEDIFSLAARLNLPYEAIVTLNAMTGESVGERELLIPNMAGVFVPEKATNDLDRLMQSWRNGETESIIVTRKGKKSVYRFFPNERFHPLERAYFLHILFRFPLPAGTITSRYGLRRNPITGTDDFHGGLDLGAPQGTEVMAASGGTVKLTGTDPVLGTYIVLSHFGGYETVYGHLKEVLIKLNMEIKSGEIIGIVGNTGTSTGPHLHFEIRSNGRTKNPEVLLPRGNR